MSRYPTFDRASIQLRPLAERGHDLLVSACASLQPPRTQFLAQGFDELLDCLREARRSQRPVILFMGAHPIKLGLSHFLIDLVEKRWITHVATNGAGVIHDFELAMFGGTSENVSRWIAKGQFGLWRETAGLNDIIEQAAEHGEGIGEAVGRTLVEQSAPHVNISLCAAAYRCRTPLTAHVTVGGDITHGDANCCGAALGAASHTDFLIFARAVQDLEGGVLLNVGTAVTGPEVYLKALSMARNVALQRGESIRRFTTAVFDLTPLPADWREGPPDKSAAGYYYRPWKTILCRTVADGGRSFYFQGEHQRTIPTLWWRLVGEA